MQKSIRNTKYDHELGTKLWPTILEILLYKNVQNISIATVWDYKVYVVFVTQLIGFFLVCILRKLI